MPSSPTPTLASLAQQHLHDVLALSFEHSPQQAALLVFDLDSPLAQVLTEAYRACLPEAENLDFHAHAPQTILDTFAALPQAALVVLVQSTHFRLDAYRLRVELFKRGLKVIEHPHLGRMQTESEIAAYVDALAYDPAYYRNTGLAIKQRLDAAQNGIIDSGGELLHFPAGFESAKLNVGDYSGMANMGGQFPIGEVFTESRDLAAVHGRVKIFIFGDSHFLVNHPPAPITLIVEGGQVVGTENATPEFEQVLANIRRDDGVIWVRELGFGLNPAFSKTRTVRDIGTYERMCGVHLSLGSKHGSYAKPQLKRGAGRHHVDVFVDTQAVKLDGLDIYQYGQWQAKVALCTTQHKF